MKQSLNMQSLQALGIRTTRRLGAYSVVLFLLLLAGVYGFVLWRISTLSAVQPSDDEVQAQVEAAVAPHVDSTVVKQLQDLQDHSVSVHTLFDEARRNPFEE